MFISNVGMISDSTFRVQQDAGAGMGLARGAGSDSSPQVLLRSEQNLDKDSLNNQLTAKAAETAEESQKKARDENIKQSFSAFA